MLHLLALCFISSATAASLPAGVKTCSRSMPDINTCIQQAIQGSIGALYPGVESLNLESLDPLLIDNLKIDKMKNDGSPVDVDLQWNDVTITGIKSAKIVKAEADWDKGLISFEGELSETLLINGQYTVDGVVLILPLHGSGPFNMQLEGLKTHIKIQGHEENRDGQVYFEVDRLAFTFDTTHVSLHYENLFNGDKALGDPMNAFLNENWKDILQEMTPAIEATMSSHIQAIAQHFFNQIPLSEIAPP